MSDRPDCLPRAWHCVFAAIVAWAAACGDGAVEPPRPDPLRPSAVTVIPANSVLAEIGATAKMSSEVRDQNGQVMTGAGIAWTSSDASVAAVDVSGLVTGAGNGTVTITATVGPVSGTAMVTVAEVTSSSEREALVALYEATDGPNWARRDNWLSDRPLDEWYGVDADASGRVVGLDLTAVVVTTVVGNGLRGPIPPELGKLARLEYLDLYGNDLTGPIPLELSSLTHLRVLSLSNNRLTGEIPPELAKLVRLEGLVLYGNDLTGSIPVELVKLASLRHLNLSSNQLTGAIPAGIGALSNLGSLSLRYNRLIGPIPQSFLGLQLEYLGVQGNPGLCFPSSAAFNAWLGDIEYGHDAYEIDACNAADVSALTIFHAATGGSGWTRSDGWASERPVEEWYGVEADSLGMVVGLDLADNNVAGDLPSSLANLVALRKLRLTGNTVTGRLPLGFASLPLHTVLLEPTVCAPSETEFQSWWATVPTKIHLPACAPLSERDLLAALYHAMGGGDWHRNDNWLSDAPLSTWYGVETTSGGAGQKVAYGRPSGVERPGAISFGPHADMLLDSDSLEEELAQLRSHWKGADYRDDADVAPSAAWAPVRTTTDGSVVTLNLAYNGLTGRIPSEIGYLSNLEWLDLNDNELKGAIPPEIGNLSSLKYLNLRVNELKGAIPPNLGDLSSLEHLNLRINELTGVIPPDLGSLTKVKYFDLSQNALTGNIPPELGNLANVNTLYLFGNGFTGAIPPELGNLESVASLHLTRNELSGAIPSELGNLGRLEELGLWGNRLAGTIPPELGRLSRLERLELSRNELTATIPPELGNLSNLEYFSVTRNQLSGPIPPEFGRLTNLEILALGGNEFSGSIPSELGSRSSRLQEIYLWGNSFEGGFGSSFGNLPNLKVLYAPNAGFSGPVPPSFGQLSALEWLYLAENPEMSGKLPSTLTALDELDRFLVGGTGLCAPADPAFQAWLEGVTMQHGISECSRGIVARAYLVQAVQSARDPVPLVAGRDALLRVFVTADSAVDVNVPPVRASFYNDGALVHTVDIAALDAPIASEPAERSLTASSNAEIPGTALGPGLEMVIEIDPGGTLDPALGVAERIPEAGRLALDVREVPPFEITVVPFAPTDGEDRALLERIQGLAADDPLFRDTRTLLPVNDMTVAVRDPVVTSTNDMFVLLRELEALRVTDGASGYYMGTLAGEWSSNSPSGVAQNVPSRSQMSRLDGSTIAHEFGHNLHLYHAPCGDPWNTDTGYPHEQGTIGAWGYDFATGSLVNPGQADLMTYCDPAWVSPYHFSNALRWRRKSDAGAQAAASVVAERMLLLWGGADADGTLALEPAFLFDGQPSLPDSAGDWRVKGEAGDDSELFALDFHMAEVTDSDGRRAFVFAIPANPSWEGNLARVVLTGPGGQVSVEGDRGPPMAILRDAATGRIRGFLRDPPDVEALTRGEPLALASLGVDPERIEVTVSRGVPGVPDWRR